MKLKALSLGALALGSSLAFAYPDSAQMTCADAKNYIDTNGSATLATCGEYATFSSLGCDNNHEAVAAYVMTKDVALCYVGSFCRTAGRGGGGSYIQDGGDTCTGN